MKFRFDALALSQDLLQLVLSSIIVSSAKTQTNTCARAPRLIRYYILVLHIAKSSLSIAACSLYMISDVVCYELFTVNNINHGEVLTRRLFFFFFSLSLAILVAHIDAGGSIYITRVYCIICRRLCCSSFVDSRKMSRVCIASQSERERGSLAIDC